MATRGRKEEKKDRKEGEGNEWTKAARNTKHNSLAVSRYRDGEGRERRRRKKKGRKKKTKQVHKGEGAHKGEGKEVT